MKSPGKPRQGFSILESNNWYSYVSNNPVNYIDPNGLFNVPAAIVAGLVGAGSDLALQIVPNLIEGKGAFEDIDVSSVIVSGLAGAAAGGTGMGAGTQAKKGIKAAKAVKTLNQNLKARKIAMAAGKVRNPAINAIKESAKKEALKELGKAAAIATGVPIVKNTAKAAVDHVESKITSNDSSSSNNKTSDCSK